MKKKKISNPIITNHAEDRIIERCGIKKKSVDRMVQIVLEKGYSHNQLKGRLRKWVDGIYLKDRKLNNIKLYGDKAYLFTDNKLITALQIPNDLTKDFKKMVKEKPNVEKRK